MQEKKLESFTYVNDENFAHVASHLQNKTFGRLNLHH